MDAELAAVPERFAPSPASRPAPPSDPEPRGARMARQRAEGHSDAIRRARLATDTDLATERLRGDDYAAENERRVALAEASKDDLRAERDRLHNLFMQAPAILCVLRGPSHVYELVNPIYRKVIGGRDVVGKPIREALPELEGLGISSSATSRVAS